jgi:FtsH-binding integral membrane protein
MSPPQHNSAGNPQKNGLISTEKLDRDINLASGIALLSGLVLLFVLAFVLSTRKPFDYNPFSAWNLINVPILLGLGFGVGKRSRVCSVLLVIYAAFALVSSFVVPKQEPRAVPLAVFLFLISRGTLAIFRYHALQRTARESAKIETSSEAASSATVSVPPPI